MSTIVESLNLLYTEGIVINYSKRFCGGNFGFVPSLSLIDYGFVYHRDPNFPQDDISWFLIEKNNK